MRLPRVPLAGLAAGVALLAGCPPPDEDITVLDERFEEPLNGRWVVSEGGVELVETYHPGEHGARFPAPTTMAIPMSLDVWNEYDDGNWLEYSTDCRDARELWVEETAPGTYAVHVAIAPDVGATPADFERVYANLPPLPQRDLNDPNAVLPSIDELVLHALEPGPCVIDNLRVVRAEPEEVW